MTDVIRRPRLVGPIIAVVAMLVVLIGLGSWQLERKVWKEGLIDMLERRLAAAPTVLPPRSQWAALTQADDEFRKVRIRAEPFAQKDARVYSNGTALRDDIKGPGIFVLTPARVPDGGIVVVNRGFVSSQDTDAAAKALAASKTPIDIVGVLRWPEPRGAFVSDYNAQDDLWFVRDPAAMAARYGWGEVAPFYIEQETPVPPAGFPAPGHLRVNLRNEHLQYAITWYGLAAALAVIFLVWLRGRNRSRSS